MNHLELDDKAEESLKKWKIVYGERDGDELTEEQEESYKFGFIHGWNQRETVTIVFPPNEWDHRN